MSIKKLHVIIVLMLGVQAFCNQVCAAEGKRIESHILEYEALYRLISVELRGERIRPGNREAGDSTRRYFEDKIANADDPDEIRLLKEKAKTFTAMDGEGINEELDVTMTLNNLTSGLVEYKCESQYGSLDMRYAFQKGQIQEVDHNTKWVQFKANVSAFPYEVCRFPVLQMYEWLPNLSGAEIQWTEKTATIVFSDFSRAVIRFKNEDVFSPTKIELYDKSNKLRESTQVLGFHEEMTWLPTKLKYSSFDARGDVRVKEEWEVTNLQFLQSRENPFIEFPSTYHVVDRLGENAFEGQIEKVAAPDTGAIRDDE